MLSIRFTTLETFLKPQLQRQLERLVMPLLLNSIEHLILQTAS
jgi:hypothetical protein